jgi:LCP family protein required for cell wall assembly
VPSSPIAQSPAPKRLTSCTCLCIGLLVFLVIVTGGAFALYQIQVAPTLDNVMGKMAIRSTGSFTSGGRINILLLGSDTDGKGNDPNNGTPLAQTVMILTIDPRTNYVGMLSIPRDMQVTEDGYTQPKLDEVFSHGYTGDTMQEKIARGAGTMEDIIQYNFGIHIDHYAWVGLDGFVKVVNTAGGIDVDILHPMVDDTYPDDVGNANGSVYDYKRLYIAPGPQHLGGAQALDYVRTRHSDLIGDFGRTVRQQQIINELKIKLATPDTIEKASALLQALNGSVQTDMQLNDIVDLGNLARSIDSSKVDHLTLGPPDYAMPSTDGGRPGNYLPVCDNIVPAIQKMFNIGVVPCASQAMSNNNVARMTPSIVGTAACPCPPFGVPYPSPIVYNMAIVPNPLQTSTSNGTGKNNLAPHTDGNSMVAGVHGLLDVLFATTFESFDGLQI